MSQKEVSPRANIDLDEFSTKESSKLSGCSELIYKVLRNLILYYFFLKIGAMAFDEYLFDTESANLSDTEVKNRIEAIIGSIDREFDVQLAFELSDEDIKAGYHGSSSTLANNLEASQEMLNALGRYPEQTINTSGLQRIVILQNFSYIGRSSEQGLVGHTDYNLNTIYLVNFSLETYTNADYFLSITEGTFHHELEHLLDFSDGIETDNPQWVDINTDKLHAYNPETYSEQDLDPHGLIEAIFDIFPAVKLFVEEYVPNNGFSSIYAKTNPEEDQAEIAQLLMSQRHRFGRYLYDHHQDPVLATKLANMKGKYLEWSNGMMDESYWNDLRAGEVDEGYWDEREIR